MQTQAIDNRAMNYNNAHQRFRVEKFEMNVQKDHIQVIIASPLLQANNYNVEVRENILRLKLIDHSDNSKSFSLPLTCELYLPKVGYNAIGKQTFNKGILALKLFTSSLKEEPEQKLVERTA